MRTARRLVAVVALAFVAGCTLGAEDAKPTPTPSPTVHGCRVTPVHTDAVPSEVPGFTGSSDVPWMEDRDLVTVLFYAAGADIVMRAGGRMAPDKNTKILWWVDGAGDGQLVLHGREPTTERTFTQRIDGLGGGQYPSVVDVPAKGCWTLRATAGGRTVGAISIPVEAAI